MFNTATQIITNVKNSAISAFNNALSTIIGDNVNKKDSNGFYKHQYVEKYAHAASLTDKEADYLYALYPSNRLNMVDNVLYDVKMAYDNNEKKAFKIIEMLVDYETVNGERQLVAKCKTDNAYAWVLFRNTDGKYSDTTIAKAACRLISNFWNFVLEENKIPALAYIGVTDGVQDITIIKSYSHLDSREIELVTYKYEAVVAFSTRSDHNSGTCDGDNSTST